MALCQAPDCNNRRLLRHDFCGQHMAQLMQAYNAHPPQIPQRPRPAFCSACGESRQADDFVVGTPQKVCWQCYFKHFEKQVQHFLSLEPSPDMARIYDGADGRFVLVSGSRAFWGLMRCSGPMHNRVREVIEALGIRVALGALPEASRD